MTGLWIILGTAVALIFGYIALKNKNLVDFTGRNLRNLKWKHEPKAIYIKGLKRGDISREAYEYLVSDEYGVPIN
jgi:hypothetical protein